jgi:hypothetical protein
VLKKAGIITAGVAATLVAVSPLAFASEGKYEGSSSPKNVGIISDGGSSSANGLIAVNALNDAEVLKNVNVCPNVDVTAALSVLGILGGPAYAEDGTQAAACEAGDTAGIFQK